MNPFKASFNSDTAQYNPPYASPGEICSVECLLANTIPKTTQANKDALVRQFTAKRVVWRKELDEPECQLECDPHEAWTNQRIVNGKIDKTQGWGCDSRISMNVKCQAGEVLDIHPETKEYICRDICPFEKYYKFKEEDEFMYSYSYSNEEVGSEREMTYDYKNGKCIKWQKCYENDKHKRPFPEYSFDRERYLGIPGSMDHIRDDIQYPWLIFKKQKDLRKLKFVVKSYFFIS